MFLSAGVTFYFGPFSVIAFSKAKSNRGHRIIGGMGGKDIRKPSKVAAAAL